MPEKINLKEKLSKFTDIWSPKIIGELNDCHLRLFKAEGEFTWHSHPDEDELFILVEGELTVHFREGDVHLMPGELLIIPKGVEHMPYAPKGASVLLIEPKNVVNTGDAKSDKTVENMEWI